MNVADKAEGNNPMTPWGEAAHRIANAVECARYIAPDGQVADELDQIAKRLRIFSGGPSLVANDMPVREPWR